MGPLSSRIGTVPAKWVSTYTCRLQLEKPFWKNKRNLYQPYSGEGKKQNKKKKQKQKIRRRRNFHATSTR